METFISTSVGIILGGILSYIISRFYYKKSIKTKSLSVFVDFISSILDDIDPEVKTKLKVNYKDNEVEQLYQIQLVIANSGDFAIRGLIDPLTIEIPNDGEILDVSFVHIEPEGRSVTYKINSNKLAEFNFALLNPSEFFIVKFLIKGNPPIPTKEQSEKDEFDFRDWQYSQYICKLTAEDLPPSLKFQDLPFDYEELKSINKFDYSTLIGSIFILAIAFSFGYVLYYLGQLDTSLNIFSIKSFFLNFKIISLPVLIDWIILLILVLVGLGIPISELNFSSKSKTPKLKIPKQIYRARRYWY